MRLESVAEVIAGVKRRYCSHTLTVLLWGVIMKRAIFKYLALVSWLACGLAMASSAIASHPQSITIYGHAYPLVLTENRQLTRQLGQSSMVAKHYQGQLTDQPGSWVRISSVDGRWQGVVILSGEVYLIDVVADPQSAASQQKSAAGEVILNARPVSSSQAVVCDTGHPTHAKALLNPNVHSALEVPGEVAFSSLCASTVNGVCLLAEMEFAFDELFQDEFAANAQAQAESLINMVEGFYRNDFNIIFDTITLELLSGDVFDATTDSDVFLEDIKLKKRNNQLPFIKNSRALLHVVTGRDFDEDTAGIAYLDVLCNRFGFGAGTSQLLRRSNGSPNLSLTALVVAHELGHNFGASHDGDSDEGNACSDSGFIMAPSVSSSVSQFSSCSVSIIEAAISALNTPESCFNFPVDIGIAADSSNPATVAAGSEVTLLYDVAVSSAFRSASTIQISGSVPASQGQINAAEINGQSCTVAGDGLSYLCNINNPQPSMSLRLDVVANVDGAGFTQQVEVVNDSELVDIDGNNDQLVTSLNVTGLVTIPAAASGVTVSQGAGTQVVINWTDNSDNEDGFRIERRIDSGAFSESGTVSSNTSAFTDTTSNGGTSYGYRVVAFNSAGDSAASNIASITSADPTPPPAPTPVPPASSDGGGSTGWLFLVMLSLTLLWRPRRPEVLL